MKRISNQNVYAAFILLCNKLHVSCFVPKNDMKRFKENNEFFPEPKWYASDCRKEGVWSLDYYKGWQIQATCNVQGGVELPLGSLRRTNREMYECIHFLLDGLRYLDERNRPKEVGEHA